MSMTAQMLPASAPAAAIGTWQRALPLLLALVALLWLFRETALAMVGIWSRSDTFAHAFLVPPISLWLMWRKRTALARTEVVASPIWLLPMLAGCAIWLLGQLAGVHAAAQWALVALIACAVPAVLGTKIARVVAFPLLFLFFSVPVGEFLIEPMMEGTADFTVAALRLSGIPVYREGLQFVIPSGNWSVVAACSGVRYLIASLMVGTLFAYLNFYSLRRRLAFVALAVVVPVVANWLRAYMIVMLGHLSSNKIAAGADHLIYGWIFFGVVILLMFMVGARFVDAPPALATMAGGGRAPPVALSQRVWVTAAAVAMLLASTQALRSHVDSARSGLPPQSTLPAHLQHWQAGGEPFTPWVPAYRNAAVVATTTYRAAGGRGDEAVGVWVGLYRDQGYERKMITSTNVLVDEGSVDWLALAQRPEQISLAAAAPSVTLRSTVLRAPADPKVNPVQRLLVWRVYRVAGRYLADDALALLWLALQRLAGRGDDAAVLVFFTPVAEDGRGQDRLRRFVSQHLAALTDPVDATSGASTTR